MGAVGEFIKVRVCPYCFVVNEKGYVERAGRSARPICRAFDTQRRFAIHLRKRHPGSLMLATIKAEA